MTIKEIKRVRETAGRAGFENLRKLMTKLLWNRKDI